MRYYDVKRSNVSYTPNDYYREHMQALIDDRWDNTTTLYNVEEEYPFASFAFRDVEVHITHALDKSTGKKQGDDFREIIFQDIDYLVNLGNYYKFDDAYWLAINLDQANRTTKNIIVRRCNNVLKWNDFSTGETISFPCIAEYDATSSSPLIDNNIITPNNKIRLTVQYNDDTSQIKVNHRFILGGRPFKVIGYNNYMIDTIGGVQNIIYLNVELDEISPYDDFVNNIAYNKDVPTTPTPVTDKNGIYIEPEFTIVRQGYTITFAANVYVDNVKQSDAVTIETFGAPEWAYIFTSEGSNSFKLQCKKVCNIPLELSLTSGALSKTVYIQLASMF